MSPWPTTVAFEQFFIQVEKKIEINCIKREKKISGHSFKTRTIPDDLHLAFWMD